MKLKGEEIEKNILLTYGIFENKKLKNKTYTSLFEILTKSLKSSIKKNKKIDIKKQIKSIDNNKIENDEGEVETKVKFDKKTEQFLFYFYDKKRIENPVSVKFENGEFIFSFNEKKTNTTIVKKEKIDLSEFDDDLKSKYLDELKQIYIKKHGKLINEENLSLDEKISRYYI